MFVSVDMIKTILSDKFPSVTSWEFEFTTSFHGNVVFEGAYAVTEQRRCIYCNRPDHSTIKTEKQGIE